VEEIRLVLLALYGHQFINHISIKEIHNPPNRRCPPRWATENIFSEDLPIELQKLLLHARKLDDEDIKK